jgi:CRP-like cAMP-binding protein
MANFPKIGQNLEKIEDHHWVPIAGGCKLDRYKANQPICNTGDFSDCVY